MDLQLDPYINPDLLDSVDVSPLLHPVKRTHFDDLGKLVWKVFQVDGLGYFRTFDRDHEIRANKLVTF